MDGLTDAERQSYMTLWAIEAAPLYSGDDLTKLDSYGLSLLTNYEVIAVDQAGNPAKPVSQRTDQQVWYARNSDGSYTVALFNLGASTGDRHRELERPGHRAARRRARPVESQQPGCVQRKLLAPACRRTAPACCASPRRANNPSMPANLHGTASTASSVSLAWDPSAAASPGTTSTTAPRWSRPSRQPSATVTGLAPGTTYSFTVAAYGAGGSDRRTARRSSLTTPAAGGPASYEAEAAANTIAGGRRDRVLLGVLRRREGRESRRHRHPDLQRRHRPAGRHLPHDSSATSTATRAGRRW